MTRVAKRIGAGLVVLGGSAAWYFRFLRDKHMHWGASEGEASCDVAGATS